MKLTVTAEDKINFDIEVDGHWYFLRQKGGTWELMKDGAVIQNLGDRRLNWTVAIARALDFVSAEVTNS